MQSKKKKSRVKIQKHYFAEVKMCEQNSVCSYSFSVFEQVLGELEKSRCVKEWSKVWKSFQKKIK